MDTKPLPDPAVKPGISWNELCELVAHVEVGISKRIGRPVSDLDAGDLLKRVLRWCRECEILVYFDP